MSIEEIKAVAKHQIALQKIDEVLKLDPVDRHSYFQLKYFVVNKEPTHQSKLWRCIREITSRKDTIQGLMLEIADQKDELELLEIKIKRAVRAVPRRAMDEEEQMEIHEREIRIRQLNRKKESICKTIHSLEKRLLFAEEEALFFVEAFKSLETKGGIKPFDDLESQKEYWNERFKQKFRLGSVLGFRPDLELVETILTLNDDAPVKKEMVGLIEDIQNRALAALKAEKPRTPLPEEPMSICTVEKEPHV